MREFEVSYSVPFNCSESDKEVANAFLSDACERANSVFAMKCGKLLLVITLLEILLGGNGYLTEIGGVRVRVVLYVFCMAWVVTRLLSGTSAKLPRQIWELFFLFLLVTCIGAFVGLLNGNSVDAIASELKALLYFPMILFFALAIREKKDVALVSRLIVVCGVAQALAYLAIMVVMHAGFVPYSTIYMFLRESDEFVFRHNPDDEFFVGFFYKGAFHLSVAALFLLIDPVRKNRWLALIVLSAIILTLTRGLMAALILSLVVCFFLTPRKRWGFVLLSGVLLGVGYLFTDVFTGLFELLQRPESDEVRLADISIIGSEVNASMLVIGKGLGAFIGERERIEMTYLEVFYKQGGIGFLFWVLVLLVNTITFRRVSESLRTQALVFYLATLFVYFATATNTFLTGSIGMSIVLVSTVVQFVMKSHVAHCVNVEQCDGIYIDVAKNRRHL